MVDKRKILDAWIMAEMLASGDVKSSNLSKFEAEEYQKTGYYQLLLSRISKCRSWSKNNKVVIYFDIFDFSKVLDGLRKEYRFEEINPEVLSGEKVGFILKFQENNQRFKLLGNELFISSSYYLKNKGKVPDVEEFIKFEREFK